LEKQSKFIKNITEAEKVAEEKYTKENYNKLRRLGVFEKN
jgi:hypothetical protein